MEAKTEIQGRNLDVGTEAETVEEHYLLVFFPWLSHLRFVYSLGIHAEDNTTQNGKGMGSATSIYSEGDIPTDIPTASYDGGNSSLAPSSHETLCQIGKN